MTIPTKYIVPGALIAVILVIAVAFSVRHHDVVVKKQAATATTVPTPPPTPATSVSFAGVEGKTAIETLKTLHKVETKKISSGDVVTSIDGRASDEKNSWVFYINGVYATEGADVYKAKKGDLIAFRFEKI